MRGCPRITCHLPGKLFLKLSSADYLIQVFDRQWRYVRVNCPINSACSGYCADSLSA